MMERSTLQVDMMKPLLFKAGIPLTLSVAALLIAKLVARRGVPKDNVPDTPVNSTETDSQSGSEESFYSLGSCSASDEYEEPLVVDANLGEEILGLKSRIDDLLKRESELEMRFMSYNDLKERESVLMQLGNMTELEKAQTEFLDREISLMEDESRSLEKFFELCSRLLEQLEYWKSKNGLLQRKVKNLSRRKRVQSSLIQERDVKIRAREAELSRTREALETSTNVVEKLEDEIRELRIVLDQMQEEKNEVLNKLELEEKSASSLFKIEDEEEIIMEEENRPANEVEQENKNQEWSNAYLRHELSMKNREHQDHNQKKGDWEIDFELENHVLDEEFEGTATEKNEMASDQTCSKRKKFIQRLRKWVVEGCEKGKGKVEERERHEAVKCFGRHSVSDEAEQEHLQGRRSCSSI